MNTTTATTTVTSTSSGGATTKEQLQDTVREWVKLDNEIARLKTEVKERENKKKALTGNLVTIMKTHNISCFDMSGGALVYKKDQKKKALSGKSLLQALQNYFKDKPEEFAEDITKFVMENREIVEKDIIKMRVDK
jgi:hypothetical protein